MRYKKIIMIYIICMFGFLIIRFVKNLFATVNDSLLQNVEIYIGQTYQIDDTNPNVEYTCCQNNLIKIDNGLFTGLAAGEATIKVSVKGSLLYKTFEIDVKEHPYVIDSSPEQIQVNSTLTLSATDIITYKNVIDVQWMSSDETVATVDENGVVTGIQSGNVKIFLKHNNVVESVKNIEVLDNVVKVSHIVISSGNNVTLNPHQTSQIVCQLYPSNVTDSKLNYTIDDKSVASINSNGLITAKKIGNTTITVSSNDLNAIAYINLTIENQLGYELTTHKLQETGIDDATKLMIVAHPDDETLWGGGHLAKGNWFVVCMTNGDNQTRNSEFYRAIESLGANGIILSYPDKVNGERSNWEDDKINMIEDLEFVIRYKDWEQIGTHNQEGEYGHIHHKMTHAFVTSVTKNAGQLNKLYYFGKYYTKNNLPDNLESNISEDYIEKKKQAYKIYASQANTILKFNQMTSHEHWTKAIN